MKNLGLYFAILLLFLRAGPALGQQINFNKVTSPIGTFSGMVGGIAQDRNGYLWIATAGGLYKYDGYRFKLYAHDPTNPNSLVDNRLETVYADRKGFIWIASWINGLDRLDPVTGTFTHFRHDPNKPGSLSNDTVRTILEDREGTLWIGTYSGLAKYSPETNTFLNYRHHPKDPGSLSCNRVRKIYEDRAGTLWIGTGSIWNNEGGLTEEGGLNRFDKKSGKFTRYLHDPANPRSLLNNKVQAICEDSKGTFWVGTAGDGLHTMDRATGTFQRHQYDPAQPQKLSRPPLKTTAGADHITFIAEDVLGNVWIGTFGNGIARHNPNTGANNHYINKESDSGFTGNSAWSFCNTRDGIFWIGTSQGSLFRVDPYHKNIPHVATGSMVTSFLEDPVNGSWIGTVDGLLLRNKATGAFNKFLHNPLVPNSISHNHITSVFQDREGILWIGTANGLNRLNPNSLTFTRYVNNANDQNTIGTGNIYAIEDAEEGYLWVGTDTGLDLMNKKTGTFQHFRHHPNDPTSLAGNNVSALLRDKSGNLWVALHAIGGLNYLDRNTGSFKHVLKGIAVLSLHRDAAGIIWAGTQATGLYRSTNAAATEFIHFTDLGGDINNSTVSAIQEDNQHNIWISSSTGIYRINPSNNQASVFSNTYGVKAGGYNYIGHYKGAPGKIYFGDVDGYYVISPDDHIPNPVPPQVTLTDFRLGGKSVILGKKSPLTQSLELIRKINLQHDQNVIGFDFAAIHFSNPEYNRHLYQLENYDPDWREAGTDKSAFYYNVPPGHYTFRVKAASSEGKWAEKAIDITITPPWWRTWWAYGLYASLFIAGSYTLHRFQRQSVIRAERERAQVRELVQAKEIEKAYTALKATQVQLIQSEKMASLGELTAGIAHEIQNPLNFVNNFSEVSEELVEELEQEALAEHTEEVLAIAADLRQNLQKIHQHGKRADAIVKNMLEHSRATTGEKQLTNLNALADEYLRLAYHGLRAKDKSFTCTLDTYFDLNLEKVEVVPQELGRVLLNLYNNAFYAVQQRQKLRQEGYEPKVTVSTHQQEGQVEIRVRDNGTGMPERVKQKIFQPFFTTKPTGQGTGLGLSLSYDIITKGHGGQLKVESAEGEYSQFSVLLPVQTPSAAGPAPLPHEALLPN